MSIDPKNITAPTISELPPTQQEREAFDKAQAQAWPPWAYVWKPEEDSRPFHLFRLAVAYGRALEREENPVKRIKAYREADKRICDLKKKHSAFIDDLDEYVYFEHAEFISLLDIQPMPKTPEELQAEADAKEDEAAWEQHQKTVGKHSDREDDMLAYAHFLAGLRWKREQQREGGAK